MQKTYAYINDHGDPELINCEEGQLTYGLIKIDNEEYEVLMDEPF